MSKKIKFSEEFINTFDGSYQDLENIVSSLNDILADGSLASKTSSITFGGEYDQIIEIKL